MSGMKYEKPNLGNSYIRSRSCPSKGNVIMHVHFSNFTPDSVMRDDQNVCT